MTTEKASAVAATHVSRGAANEAPKDAVVENYSPIYSSSILLVETQFTSSSIEESDSVRPKALTKSVISAILPKYLSLLT